MLAAAISARMAAGGVIGGRPAYSDHGAVKVTPGYVSGGARATNGAFVFRSSADMRGRSGYANASGGMWRGLRATRSSEHRATLAFVGTSLGANPIFSASGVSGVRVSNTDKATTVLAAHQRNVLELAPGDIAKARDLAVQWLGRRAGRAVPSANWSER